MDLNQICQRLGAAKKEIISVVDHELGVIVDHLGTKYIIVPDEKPDGDGKTGLMYLEQPKDGSNKPVSTTFPVFTPHTAEVEAPAVPTAAPAPAQAAPAPTTAPAAVPDSAPAAPPAPAPAAAPDDSAGATS